jgi:hypothetical protein
MPKSEASCQADTSNEYSNHPIQALTNTIESFYILEVAFYKFQQEVAKRMCDQCGQHLE